MEAEVVVEGMKELQARIEMLKEEFKAYPAPVGVKSYYEGVAYGMGQTASQLAVMIEALEINLQNSEKLGVK
ncbi:hypothetical protein [Endozoicomonas arenosclerae]|uniref:hypothetical protein n=1 Tax=Endozoicomonas arenosclerae TaxID=1633495 RepID=UPI00078546CD|nr:hypothetical protein [Endozoicomonas arenosclerae]